MSRLVGVFGVQHNPLLWRALEQPTDPDLRRLRDAFGGVAEQLRGVRPDVVLVIATDHLTQWFYENMPTFLVGKAELVPATFPNEEREFGITRELLHGDVDLGAWVHEDGIAQGIDFAASDSFRADHSILVPLRFLTPGYGIPIVPVFTNAIAPPLPTAERFYLLGQVLRRAIESCPLDRRVAVVASGHLATEVGGPRQFSGSPDPAFDTAAVRAVREGALDEMLAISTYERLLEAGNVTHQFLNYVTAAGLVNGNAATSATALESRFATTPFFVWTGEELR